MTIEERRDRDKERMKELILGAAADIMAVEGLEKLSVRKIASRIEYSPAIIYHYFRDKDDIVNQVMLRGYANMVCALSASQSDPDDPVAQLKHLTRSYIETALKFPDQYLFVHLSRSPSVLAFTAFMNEGAVLKKPALEILARCIRNLDPEKKHNERKIEMTAQIVAASTLGFVIKLIIERDLDDVQKEDLIQEFEDTVIRMASI